jgi:hypothetical protein
MLDQYAWPAICLPGDVPNQHNGAGAFGCLVNFIRPRAPVTRNSGALSTLSAHGLDRIDDGEVRTLFIQRGENVAQVGFTQLNVIRQV